MHDLEVIINRIRRLYLLASSTNFPDEAETALALAQQLITKYQIDSAILNLGNNQSSNSYYVTQDWVQMPFNESMLSILLDTIAKHNFCRVMKGSGYCLIFGYVDDIKLCKDIFDILSLHMQSEHDQKLASVRRSALPGFTPSSWSKSFYIGYCRGVNERLKHAHDTAINDMLSTGTSVELASRDKQHAVEEYYQSQPYKLRAGNRHDVSTASSGYISGHASGRNADIGQTKLEE